MAGFIQSAEKLNAAQQVKQWFDSAIDLSDNLKQNKNSLVNQLALMKTNSDYSESDCNEVEALVATLDLKIKDI